MALDSFLDYWKSQDRAETQNQDRIQDKDKARHLYDAFEEAASDLVSIRGQTLHFLKPVNNGKAWVPGFDPKRIPEVVELAGKIEACEKRLESIGYDIEKYLSITGGVFEFRRVVEELGAVRGRLRRAESHASNMVEIHSRKNLGIALDDLREVPQVKEAYEALGITKEECEPKIAMLRQKMGAANEILDRYE